MKKVFIPHVAEKFDAGSNRRAPALDFSAAAIFGQLTPVLDPGDDPMFLARITPKIRATLDSFTQNDYLLAAGDPSVIAACAGVIFRRFDKVKMLKWDRKLKTYIPLEVCL
jgi:hypothetical protein